MYLALLLLICLSLFASLVAIAIFSKRLQASMAQAPNLAPVASDVRDTSSIGVVIPAYNEEINIRDCVQSVLQSDLADPTKLEVWIADDESQDATGTIARELAAMDARVKAIAVPPRPKDRVWRGKNWACANAAPHVTSEYLLFIDADVRLEPGAIAAAIAESKAHQSDLFSCAPEMICGCFSEWLVQPIMMSILAVGFNFEAVNDARDLESAFAAGPFMLFKRNAYEKIGGHRAIAGELVEDLELARLIKKSGLRLRYILGLGLIKVRMYQSFAALWEGWTKNFYMGSQRNLGATLYFALAMTLIFVMPWLGLISSTIGYLLSVDDAKGFSLLAIAMSLVAIGLQYYLRSSAARSFKQPLRYWWLGWLSGALVVAIAIASVIKTETGWGWTWRGRSLAVPTK
ncbi:glycosyltransferase [Pseudanabaena sp. PCC 6802]|uniref:glycosyltransferase n=1 Tax=Pseudanabaena sp. PCC 6802 TaxID=118173 RepID=UPI00034ACA70|nr:glycosyltransferase family 2 protein [Pseudanabaena sp. PCC 6802]